LGKCNECNSKTIRDFGADVSSMVIGVVDPYRSYDLSVAKMIAEGDQQRKIGGPSDNLERKRLESKHGIQYIGNDTSGFTKKAKRGIEDYQYKKKIGEVK
jgi:hypothetical protein